MYKSNVVYQCSSTVKGKYDHTIGHAKPRTTSNTNHRSYMYKWSRSLSYREATYNNKYLNN